jgi:superfamily II DNA or RNA helicase
MAQKYNALKIKPEDYVDQTTFKEQERLVKFAKQYWSSMSMRKWVCYNSEQKANAAIEIVKLYPDRKWIIFNKSIKSAEYVVSQLGDKAVIYHSKMKTADRQDALDKFSDNTYSYLVAVDALNAGLNVKDANSAICISGVSTELVAYQQIGQAA